MKKKFLITGGAGFIGSALVRHIINETDFFVINVDKLSYAGNLDSLPGVKSNERYVFKKVDICNEKALKKIFDEHQPDIVMHLAAESHVDRSINSPGEFIQTNIIGTYTLLEVAKEYWLKLSGNKSINFKFHHISTDEVYGDLGESDDLFTESTPYAPSSPYSASKASSDHLVRAWSRTFNLPTVITNCSNNYGPFQFPEKLIPLIIQNALDGRKLPIYGDGSQVRDWLYVEDHAKALLEVALSGKCQETYNIGGHNEFKNIDIVRIICRILDELIPSKIENIDKYEQLIIHIDDRAGHDLRYAIDASKIANDLNWKPVETFETGIRKTIKWYLENQDWCNRIKDGTYNKGISKEPDL